jgi:hypothetical protein
MVPAFWGKSVADQILAWRSTDGFSAALPPYTAGGLPGDWAPTPPAFGPPLFRQFANMTPFALTSPAQFLPAGPPSLTSERYAQDLNEVKTLGSTTSTVRTPYQTQTAVFWQVDTPAAIWNRVADTLVDEHNTTLSESSRVLALMNVALADATISIWNAKNVFDTWRPFTAIREAGSDGNPDTTADPSWTPLLATPQFQEYPSAHSGVSEAATSVLASFYGDDTAITGHVCGPPRCRAHVLDVLGRGRASCRRAHLRGLPFPLLVRRRRRDGRQGRGPRDANRRATGQRGEGGPARRVEAGRGRRGAPLPDRLGLYRSRLGIKRAPRPWVA